jgi:hypothetical protein
MALCPNEGIYTNDEIDEGADEEENISTAYRITF